MSKDDMLGKLAIYAFLGGTAIALLFGLYQAYTLGETGVAADNFFSSDNGMYVAWVLVVLGVIVGLMTLLGKGTITKQEVPAFLTAGVALLVMYAVFGNMHTKLWLGSLLNGVSYALALFIAPAVAILAIKAVWDMGKDV